MSNSLNKSMVSGWAAHQPVKRSKLNLNASTSANSSGAEDTGPTGEAGPSASASSSTVTGAVKRRTRPSSSTGTDPSLKRQKSSSAGMASSSTAGGSSRAPPEARLSSLGGLTGTIEKLLELVALPLLHPELYIHTGVAPPRGVLLHGPPGCGKTAIANALAGELGMPFISISAPSIVSGMSGESEKTLRETFEEAQKIAPCLLFIDEIDAITPKRETAQREMERRIVAQLLTLMDDLAWHKPPYGNPVIVIGATNRPDSLDPALRRAGRFDSEIAMGVPDEGGREEILRTLCASLLISKDIDFKSLAKATPGYVGADLASLTSAAGVVAVKRMFRELSSIEGQVRLGVEGLDVGGSSAGPSGASIEGEEETDGMAIDGEMDVTTLDTPATPGGAGLSGPELTPSTSAAPSAATSTPASPTALSSALMAPAVQPSSTGLFATLPESLLKTPIASFLLSHQKALPDALLSNLALLPPDFASALKTTQPSSQREGFATIPSVTWSDIGALETIRDELHMAIVQPIRRPELFRRVGIEAPGGVLLWGPPGCGKTLLAKAVANESRANFISVKGPEVLNKYVGESERAVRQVFARARASAPCIIFFDELDALVPRRDDGQSEATSRVVNTLLTELDGLESRRGIYVIGATNRPDMIDPAMARPGRLDKLLYVDLPTASERVEILKTMTRKTPLAPGIEASLARVASERCEGFSGADLAALVREAATLALRSKLEQVGAFEVDDGVLTFSGLPKDLDPANRPTADGAEAPILVGEAHFLAAATKVNPSVSGAQRRKYEMLRNKMAGLPTKGGRKGGELGEAGVGALGEGVASAGGESTGAQDNAVADGQSKGNGAMDE